MRRTTACVGALACRGGFAGTAVACETCRRRVACGQQLHVCQAFFVTEKARRAGQAQQVGLAHAFGHVLAPDIRTLVVPNSKLKVEEV